jgi:(p)ppGpp synthase/HD superfamily hydrolase
MGSSDFDRSSADALAARQLGTLRTKLGGLHIEHARRLAAAIDPADEPTVVAALLHDVLEKTPMTLEEMRGEVGDDRVLDLVEILTQGPDELEDDYLMRCAGHPMALHLKRLDLLDKVTTSDVHVPAEVAETVRAEALERLALLGRIAGAILVDETQHGAARPGGRAVLPRTT